MIDIDPDERVAFARPRELPGVEILLAENSARRWRVFHERYDICTVLRGSGVEWTYRGKLHAMDVVRPDDGALMLMEPGEVHANRRATEAADFRVLSIPPEAVQEAAEELGMKAAQVHWRLPQCRDKSVVRLLYRLHSALDDPASNVLERQSRFAGALRTVLERCGEYPIARAGATGRARLLRARDYIWTHCPESIRLEELARIAGLSRYHLVRAFAAQFGLPPHAYQVHVQVEKSRRLLADGVSPAAVASEMGFADQSHFTRHFRRINGLTPAQYRRAALR